MGPKKVIQPNKMIYISLESIFQGDFKLILVFPNMVRMRTKKVIKMIYISLESISQGDSKSDISIPTR